MADEETGRGERVYIHLWLVKESSHGEEKVPCNVPLHESGRSLLPYGRCLFKACPAGITGQSVGTTPKKTEKTSQLICIWTCGQAAIVSGQTAPTFQHSCYNNSTGPRRTRLVNGTTGLLVDKIKTTFQDDIILTITRHTHTYLISSLT